MSGVTSKEIAARLGLSPSAVSLALNGRPGVSEATRNLVISTAQKMGYDIAKHVHVVSKRWRICFVFYVNQLVSIAENTTFSSFVLQGAENAASEKGHSITVRYVRAGESLAKQLEDTINETDGFIILGTDITQDCKMEMEEFLNSISGKPAVIVDSPEHFDAADCVVNDNYGGARMAAEYFISRGIRKIGYLRSKYRISNFEYREAGLKSALKNAGLHIHTVVDTDVSYDDAYRKVNEYLNEAHELPEAFFAENDIIAAAALKAFNAHGIAVPARVSIIGFDDIPVCEMTAPSLATVHSFKEQLGEAAVNLLSAKFNTCLEDNSFGGRGCMTVSVSTKLNIRDSVK